MEPGDADVFTLRGRPNSTLDWDLSIFMFPSLKRDGRTSYLGRLVANALPRYFAAEIILDAMLELARLARFEYLVAGDGDVLSWWSQGDVLRPHLFGLYDEAIAARPEYAEAVESVAAWFTEERRGAFSVLDWRKGLESAPNAADSARFSEAFRPLSEAWEGRR